MPLSKAKKEYLYYIIMLWGEQPLESQNCALVVIIIHSDCESQMLSYLEDVLKVPSCTLTSFTHHQTPRESRLALVEL